MMNRAEVLSLLACNRGTHYVYLLFKPDGTPFYVGKGTGHRVFAHERDALAPGISHKLNTIRRIGKQGGRVHYAIARFFSCEKECHAFEMAEILRIGRHDLRAGPLTNLTAGGEGTVGLSDETKARIDADLHGSGAPGERGVANRFYLELCTTVESVPVRPLRAVGKPRPLVPLPVNRRPTPRMAAALAASAISNRVLLEPGCRLPRRMNIDGVEAIIEYGASTNLLNAGMAALDVGVVPGAEVFVLTEAGYRSIQAMVDPRLLVDAGVLMP